MLYARPHQPLSVHLNTVAQNMKARLNNILLEKITNSLSTTNDFKENELKDLILDLGYLIGITHDMGKVSPFFQRKICGEKLKIEEKSLAWHTASSAVFSYLTTLIFLEKLTRNTSTKLLKDDMIKFFCLTNLLVIINHHSKIVSERLDDLFHFSNSFDYLISGIEYIQTYASDIVSQISIESRFRFALLTGIERLNDFKDEESLRELIFDLMEEFDEIIENDSYHISFYFLFEILYSLLCDADEWDAKYYDRGTGQLLLPMDEERSAISPDLVEILIQHRKKTVWKNRKWPIEVVKLRQHIYQLLNDQATSDKIGKVLTLTAPTGSGKTLALLNFAFTLRTKYYQVHHFIPRIIYCLPFISIIDQVGSELHDILALPDLIQCEQLVIDHHLADVEWNPLNDNEDFFNYFDDRGINDYVKLWRSDIVVTTFVKFWHTVIAGSKRRILPLNRIGGSIIILDEIQSIPSRYWDITYRALVELSSYYGCTIVLSSATQPLIVPNEKTIELAEQLTQLIQNNSFSRYILTYHSKPILLQEFIEKITIHLTKTEGKDKKSLMIVMNTRKTARCVYDCLQDWLENNRPFSICSYALFFLSSYVLPIHRKRILKHLKSFLDNPTDTNIILVCTQVIEAGVDVSFDVIYRDFAPLDSLIQVAGRCNRHYQSSIPGHVDIFHLRTKGGEEYSNWVYQDPVSLTATHEVLVQSGNQIQTNSHTYTLSEGQLTDITQHYFHLMRDRKKTSDIIDAVQRLDFETIYNDFQLIKEEGERVMFFLSWDHNGRIILEEIENQLANHTNRRFTINPDFYKYTISISEKDLLAIELKNKLSLKRVTYSFSRNKRKNHLNKNRIISSNSDNREKKPLFYALKDPHPIYDEAGLKMDCSDCF